MLYIHAVSFKINHTSVSTLLSSSRASVETFICVLFMVVGDSTLLPSRVWSRYLGATVTFCLVHVAVDTVDKYLPVVFNHPKMVSLRQPLRLSC